MLKWITLLAMVLTSFAYSQTVHGKASWYGSESGNRTANGDFYSPNGMTCAAISAYKFGDKLRVTNPKNGKSVVVVVNDRGNFARLGRTLDLSRGAFARIANLSSGVVSVLIEKIN